MDGGDHRLFAAIQHVVYTLAQWQPRPVRAKTANIGTGDEAASGTDQHHRHDRRIGVATRQAILDALRDAGTQCIHWRIIHDDDANVALTFHADR